MVWKLTDKAKDREPLGGVEWRDHEDKEFREVAKDYAERNGFAPRSLHTSGYFEHVKDAGSAGEDEETPAAPAEEAR